MNIKNHYYWLGMLAVLLLAAVPRFAIVNFSLPYIDHIDEPNFYLAGLEWRGLYDNAGYYDGYPPIYLMLQYAIQPILETFGLDSVAENVLAFRYIAIMGSLVTILAIMMTARLISGDLAGIIAGFVWATSPLAIKHGVLAIPDPLVYTFSALAMWCAVIAIKDIKSSGHFAIISLTFALVAILLKYPVLPILGVPFLVTLVALVHERRKGLYILGWQLGVLIVNAAWFIIYMWGSNPVGHEVEMIEEQGIFGTIFLWDWVTNNLTWALRPVGVEVFWTILCLGILGTFITTRQNRQTIHIGGALLLIFGVITIPWVAAGFIRVNEPLIRHVMAASPLAACLIGIGVVQTAAIVSQRWQPYTLGVLILILGFTHWQSAGKTTLQLVQDYRQPDIRVELRQWFDANLPAGSVLVDHTNHKTFNPIWGGIPHQRWVDWVEITSFVEKSPEEWHQQRGVTYMALPTSELIQFENHPNGEAYLEDMLLLRTITHDGGKRGPEVRFYRLWGIEDMRDISFGGEILFRGIDNLPETVQAGSSIPIQLYWQPLKPPSANYSLFVHLVSENNLIPFAQVDMNPATQERLTLTWTDPSETLLTPEFHFQIPQTLEPGIYRLIIGLYNFETGERLKIHDSEATFYPLTNLEIKNNGT